MGKTLIENLGRSPIFGSNLNLGLSLSLVYGFQTQDLNMKPNDPNICFQVCARVYTYIHIYITSFKLSEVSFVRPTLRTYKIHPNR